MYIVKYDVYYTCLYHLKPYFYFPLPHSVSLVTFPFDDQWHRKWCIFFCSLKWMSHIYRQNLVMWICKQVIVFFAPFSIPISANHSQPCTLNITSSKLLFCPELYGILNAEFQINDHRIYAFICFLYAKDWHPCLPLSASTGLEMYFVYFLSHGSTCLESM